MISSHDDACAATLERPGTGVSPIATHAISKLLADIASVNARRYLMVRHFTECGRYGANTLGERSQNACRKYAGQANDQAGQEGDAG